MALIRESRVVDLRRELDVFVARETANLMVSGFDVFSRANVETAVSELCTNVLRHGVRGRAILRVGPQGFEAVVEDEGPGLGAAPVRTDGLGIGLAGAKRLMDDLVLENLNPGTRVIVRKLAQTEWPAGRWWEAACAISASPGEVTAGDAFLVKDVGSSVLVAVADGLGRGEAAAAGADAVLGHIKDHIDTPLPHLLAGADRAGRSSRGAVGLVARVTADRIDYAGVGDVAGMVLPSGERFILSPGFLGSGKVAVAERSIDFGPDRWLVLWSDGVRTPPMAPPPSHNGQDLQTWVETGLVAGHSYRDDAMLLGLTPA